MTSADAHPLLRYADPATRAAVAERLGIPATPEPPPPPQLDSPQDVITRLRSGRGKDPRYVLDGVTVVDWRLIVDEHRRAPFPDVIGAGLVARDDCPPDAALALVTARSTSRRGQATGALAAALHRCAVTPRQVLYEAAPAWSAVRALEKYGTKYGTWLAPIRRLFDDAAGLLPGDNPAAWLWLIAHGPGFPGTFPELCARARAVPADLPLDSMEVQHRTAHWEFASPAVLLRYAPKRVADRIVPRLPAAMRNTFAQTPGLPASLAAPLLRTSTSTAEAVVRRLETTGRTVTRMLAHPDPYVAGLAAEAFPLWADAGFDAGESPHSIAAALRGSADRANRPIPRQAWDAIVHSHAHEPLSITTLTLLAAHPHCPDALGLDACRQSPHLGTQLGTRGRAYALTSLRHHPLHVPASAWQTPWPAWYLAALADGLLDAAEFVELAFPADRMLTALDDVAALLPETHAAAAARIRGLLAALGTDVEAWTVAAHLAADFAGTLPELTATIGAVTA